MVENQIKTLEGAVAYMGWVIRSNRMTPRELAAHDNGLAHRYWVNGPKPKYGIEERIENLTQEIRRVREAIENR